MNDGISLLLYAMDRETEDKMFFRWIAGPQFEYGFEEYKQLLRPVFVNEKKVLADLDDLMENTTWEKIEIEG